MSGKKGKFVRRSDDKGLVGEGRLAFLAERTERAMKYDSAILQCQPPLDVPGGVGSHLMRIQWSTVVATVLLARRFFTPRRVERVGPAAFLLRRGDEKNLSATGIGMRLLQVFCSDAARSRQNKEESLIRRHYLLRL